MVVFVIDQQVNLNIFTPVCLPPPSVTTSTLLAGEKVNMSTSISSLAPTRWFIKWKKDFIVVVRNSRFLLKQVLLRTRQQSLGLGQLSGQRTTTTNQFFLTHFRWATSEEPLDFFVQELDEVWTVVSSEECVSWVEKQIELGKNFSSEW